MTRFKTLCILMLAVSCLVWSTQAAIQKSEKVRETPIAKGNLGNSVKPVERQMMLAQNQEPQERVISEKEDVQRTIAKDGLPVRTNSGVMTQVMLRNELIKSGLNKMIVKNADGTMTAAIKAEKTGRGTGTLNCESVYDFSLSDDGTGNAWGAELGYDTGFIYSPAFYYDISLLPETATILGANVDFYFQNAPWTPLAPAYFDINDLFTWYDGTNYTATFDDIMNTTTGNTYGSETSGFTTDGMRNYVLNSQSYTDIETQIAAEEGWFALGLDPSAMTPNGSWMMDPDYGQDVSVLYITYEAPGTGPVITSVTATPSSVNNIGFDTITFEATWTHADDLELEDFGMIYKYRTPWNTEYQFTSGGIWEKTGVGAYRWYGEVDFPQDHQIGACDVSFLITDFTFTEEWGYTVNDDLFTITTPAVEYADFNDSGPLSQWPTGWTANPVTNSTSGESWQYNFLWNGTQDYLAVVLTDYTTWSIAQDCYLTTPSVDMSTAGSAHLFFDVLFDGTPTAFTMEGSIDGFATIAESIELTTAVPAGELNVLNWNITSWAAGAANVQVRWHFTAAAGSNSEGILDVIQFVADDAPITITDTSVTPASNPVIDGAYITAFSVDFTAATTATVDDFMFDVYTRSDVGLESALITDLYNGDDMGSIIVQNSPGNFTATIGDLAFRPGIEIGVYDLMGYASNGIGWAYDDFDSNPDELTLTTPAFWYEDFNEGGASGPAGWSIISLPGGENGDDWSYEQYTGTGDWFGFVLYDQTSPADPQNEVLRSAVINCSGREDLVLYYAYEWASGFDAAAVGQVRISNNNGSTWTTIYEHTAPTAPAIETGLQELDISAYADGQSQVRLEFRYIATDDYYWSVDILQIDENTPPPIPATGPIGLGLLLVTLTILFLRRR